MSEILMIIISGISRQSFMAILSIIYLIIMLFPSLISSQTCQKTCGKLSIKYPFGTGLGCGDPRFQPHVTCNEDQQQLTFKTHTGCYPVTSIDYANQVFYIADPTMSTCAWTQPSKGFGLDWDAPFSFSTDTVFALLDCSIDDGSRSNSSAVSQMCDTQGGAAICGMLSSCQAISSKLNIQISTCCVYTPVNLGPSFDMDLHKLQCSSYSGLYGFNDLQSDPQSWIYGVAIKYKFNFNNDYPRMCDNCEKSNGVCGYNNEPYNSFLCNCPGGFNTTTDCFYGASWSNGLKLLPWKATGTLLIIICFGVHILAFLVH